MMLDKNRIEMLDTDTGELEWAGSVDDFMLANVDSPLHESEIEHLAAHGYVVVGGGAAGMFTLRYAEKTDDASVLSPPPLADPS